MFDALGYRKAMRGLDTGWGGGQAPSRMTAIVTDCRTGYGGEAVDLRSSGIDRDWVPTWAPLYALKLRIFGDPCGSG